jgi:PIN domain nuclease of toxin-antitoxin system
MTTVLLDTHAWTWSIHAVDQLSQSAQRAVDSATTVLVSPVSLYEIAQKTRLGKWPEMAGTLDRLFDILQQQGAVLAPLTAQICLAAGRDPWEHRDPFDRVIAATARDLDIAIVTRDRAMATAPGIRTIW